MRVIHIAAKFFPDYSGTTTRLYYILSQLPFETILITSDTTLKGSVIELKEEHFGNIRVKRVSWDTNNTFFRIAPFCYLHTIYQKPRALINPAKSEQFDIIHAHNPSIYGQAAELLSKRTNKPFIVEIHAVARDYPAMRKKNIETFYVERMTRNLLKACNCIVTLTESLKDWIAGEYMLQEDKIKVVPNGADVKKFSQRAENKKKAEAIKEKLGHFENVVMYAGCMDQINGIVDLAEVIPSLLEEKPDISFVFIGHGPEEGRIIALSKKYSQVKFLPMVHYNDMPFYYQMCDVFVIPRPSTISAETVTPLKLLEVMAMEKPVLGSNVGGIVELIKHGENGYLFEKGDMQSFKKTLLDVLDMANTKIGKNARKTIVDNYTWDKSAKVLQEVYEGLV